MKKIQKAKNELSHIYHFKELPDEEGVSLRRIVRCSFTVDHAVPDRPELVVALPALEVGSVEEILIFLSVRQGGGERQQDRCKEVDRGFHDN